MTVETIPYLLRNDDWLVCILIGCSLFTLFIIARSGQYIQNQIKHLFFEQANKNLLHATKTGKEIRYTFYLNLQTGFLFALLFFYYISQQATNPSLSITTSHLLIASYTIIIWLYGVAKVLLYRYVNWIFFDKRQQSSWNKSYFFLTSTEGVLFFPFILIMIFHHISIGSMTLYICILFGFVKLCLSYKTFLTFFANSHGFLHFITYLCALEIVPIYALWQALMTANKYLL